MHLFNFFQVLPGNKIAQLFINSLIGSSLHWRVAPGMISAV